MENMTKLEDNIHSSGWSILVILSCLGLIVMFDETMILPAIPDFIETSTSHTVPHLGYCLLT